MEYSSLNNDLNPENLNIIEIADPTQMKLIFQNNLLTKKALNACTSLKIDPSDLQMKYFKKKFKRFYDSKYKR